MTAPIHKYLRAHYRSWDGKLSLQLQLIKQGEYLQLSNVALLPLDLTDKNDPNKKTLCSHTLTSYGWRQLTAWEDDPYSFEMHAEVVAQDLNAEEGRKLWDRLRESLLAEGRFVEAVIAEGRAEGAEVVELPGTCMRCRNPKPDTASDDWVEIPRDGEAGPPFLICPDCLMLGERAALIVQREDRPRREVVDERVTQE